MTRSQAEVQRNSREKAKAEKNKGRQLRIGYKELQIDGTGLVKKSAGDKWKKQFAAE